MRLTRRAFLKLATMFTLASLPLGQEMQARISDLDNPFQFPIAFPLYFEDDPPDTKLFLPLVSLR